MNQQDTKNTVFGLVQVLDSPPRGVQIAHTAVRKDSKQQQMPAMENLCLLSRECN